MESNNLSNELEALVGKELAEKIEAKMTSMADELEGLNNSEKLLLLVKLAREIVSGSLEPVKRASRKAVGKTAVTSGKTVQKMGDAITKIGATIHEVGVRTEQWGIAIERALPSDQEIIEQAVSGAGLAK